MAGLFSTWLMFAGHIHKILLQVPSPRSSGDVDKKSANEVKVGVKYKSHVEGRAGKADKNLGEIEFPSLKRNIGKRRRYSQNGRQAERQAKRQASKQAGRKAARPADRNKDSQTDRQTERDRQKYKQRKREREREREADRQTE